MALSFVAASSAWVSGTGSVTPTAPAGLAVGDLVVLVLVSKYDNAVLPSDPAGWDTPGTPAVNTGRPTGNDNGNTRMRLFHRVWQSGDTMPTLSPTPNNVSTVMAAAYRSATGLFDVVAVPLADDTVGTPLEVVTPAIALAVGDHLLTVPVVNGDAPTWGTTTVTAPGITFGAATSAPADASTTSGTDLRMRSMTRAVTAGTASAAVTVSTALAGTTTNAVGTVAVVRVREGQAVAPTLTLSASTATVAIGEYMSVTADYTGTPSPSLLWDYDGGTFRPGRATEVWEIAWSTPGTKTVTVTATNAGGSVQKSVQVTVAAPPVATLAITSTGPYTAGVTPVQVSINGSNPGINLFETAGQCTATVDWGDGTADFVTNWDSDTGAFMQGETASHVYATAGPYTITLDVVRTVLVPASTQDTEPVTIVPAYIPGQVWNGTSWQFPEVWNGTRWVPGSQIEMWNGTQWVPLG